MRLCCLSQTNLYVAFVGASSGAPFFMILFPRKYKTSDILAKVSEEDIYRKYMPGEFALDKALPSPFRDEKHPSFMISTRDGSPYHKDYGNSQYRGDCFDFVQQLFGIDLQEALQRIVSDLKLSEETIITQKVVREKIKREPKIIQVIPKAFNLLELRYWNEYHQSLDDLIKENVFSVHKAFLDKERMSLPGEMVFGYLYENKYWKLYQPLRNGVGKWISTVPLTMMDGLEGAGGQVVVAKGKKDKMVLKKLIQCCSVQNESISAFSEGTISYLQDNFKDAYIAFDSDEPGVKSSWEVTKKFGFKHLNVPYIHLLEGIKDFADLAKKHGMKFVEDYLKSKSIGKNL